MGLLDNIKQQIGSQFIEILQWLDDTNDSLVYRFPVYNQEIKMNAQLTVRENQAALFINEGKAADLFGPGRYQLTTQNLPILTTLRGWKYGFQSPFKAEVYFFNMRFFTDLKWGTTNPVMMRDAEFGMIRLRAFGTYAMKISDPKTFFATIVGTHGLTTTDEITGQLRSTILSRLSDAIAESKVAALDIASKYDELSLHARQILGPEFQAYGLELSKFFIENVSLPEEVEAAIDQRTKLGVLGDRMGQYTQLQAADAMKVAAANPGGAAGAGVGIGAGIAMGGMMGGALASGMAGPPPAPGAPPPPAGLGFAAPRWSVTVDGKTYGPYTDDALKGMVAAGQVAPATLAWKPGAAGWAPLSTFEEFAGSSAPASTPPPPPPPTTR
ncbi:MAG TPA: SPFH domain-containing protein [Thermoanaerobaculia bacterium]|jgi:membrane protease subunit (stomatin/prohibitin family)|nr:SPFH domain-containing protein [Thermoanaerobaculia bacterium]